MKKAKKILALLLCAVLLIGATIAGTVAYLTSTAKVENTFTAGKVKITLDEAKVDEYGEVYMKDSGEKDDDGNVIYVPVAEGDEEARVSGNKYKLVPGKTYIKDPTIHVSADSEECYLFAKITMGDKFTISGMTDWTRITGTDVWYYNTTAKANDNVVVFKTITYSSAVAGEETPSESNIVVTAYAVQKDSFDSAADAWEAANFN